MTVPNIGRGGLPVYSPVGATLSIANSSRNAAFTGTAFVTKDSATGAPTYQVGVGDTLVVSGIAVGTIESITNATNLQLAAPWSGATQTSLASSGNPGWYIIRNSVPPYGAAAKAIQDLLSLGSDKYPDTSRTYDDGTARMKLRFVGGLPTISAGVSGAADSALIDAFQIDPATGRASMPKGYAGYQAGSTGPSIQTALSLAASFGGGVVYVVNHGVDYVITTPLKLNNKVYLVGIGDPVIKLAAGVNSDIVQTDNATAVHTLLGAGNTLTGSIYNFGIRDLTLDGNANDQTPVNPDQCNGIAFYGQGWELRNVLIRNVRGNGIRCGSYLYPSVEHPGERYKANLFNVEIVNCGRHGVWFTGPSDSFFASVMVEDAGQEAGNTYYGFWFKGNTGQIRGRDLHGWHNGTVTNRVKFQCYIDDDVSGTNLVDCHMEGGNRQLYMGQGGVNSYMGGAVYANWTIDSQIIINGPAIIHTHYYGGSSPLGNAIVLQVGGGSNTFNYDVRMEVVYNDATTTTPVVLFNGTNDAGGLIEMNVVGCYNTGGLTSGTIHPDTKGRIWQMYPTRMSALGDTDRKIKRAGITANTTFVVPAGYAIRSMYIVNSGGGAVTGGIKLGTTSGGADVISAKAIGAFSYNHVTDAELLKRAFNISADTTLYLQAVTGWGTASLMLAVDLVQIQ
jgi:hypothetical protein